MSKRMFKIWRGNAKGGEWKMYAVDVEEGMVVLDAILRIQAYQSTDLAVRWNCKAGKCGSCSMEINGMPKLSCMTRMNDYAPGEEITVQPMKSFDIIKDLVADVSWNYEQNKRIAPFQPKASAKGKPLRMTQEDVDRVQEFRKCIECFLCQDVCHVLRDHQLHDKFIGPQLMVFTAALEMHPLDNEDRLEDLAHTDGIGYCNITKCCTKVCPEHITITDNAIIPLKERVVDQFYDPVKRLFRGLGG